MKKRLIYKALFTSPIIAIYGVVPVFLFHSIGLFESVVSFVSLTIVALLFWLFNIFLIQKNLSTVSRYLVSYLATFFLHSGTIYIVTTTKDLSNPAGLLLYSIIATLAVNTILLVIINSEMMKTKREQAELENQHLKVVNLEAQKKVLMQQLHPHFLFNALSTLKSLIRENQEHAEDYSVKLSEFLRYSINFHNTDLVTLKEELQFASDYVELQKVRFGNALTCNFNIPEEFLMWKLPAFALQTLLENAIKHNSFTEKRPLVIDITADKALIRVTNNKSPKPLLPVSGTGLKNLAERYRIISNSGIEVFDYEHEFTVHLNLIAP